MDFPELIIRSHSDLADAFRAIKDHLQLSNEQLEAISGMAAGHCDKLLGPTRSKRIGPRSLDLLLGALGVRLRVEIDPDQARRMASRWEKRKTAAVRRCQPISQQLLDRVRPFVLSELARKGWKTRRQAQRRNGRANGHHNGNGHADRHRA